MRIPHRQRKIARILPHPRLLGSRQSESSDAKRKHLQGFRLLRSSGQFRSQLQPNSHPWRKMRSRRLATTNCPKWQIPRKQHHRMRIPHHWRQLPNSPSNQASLQTRLLENADSDIPTRPQGMNHRIQHRHRRRFLRQIQAPSSPFRQRCRRWQPLVGREEGHQAHRRTPHYRKRRFPHLMR